MSEGQHMSTRPGDVSGAKERAQEDGARLLRRCLSLDLEVGRDERIHALAGVRPDTSERLVFPQARDEGLDPTALAKTGPPSPKARIS